jgi:hypothetical protein
MLQIVHDIAPGASLAFATARGGKANFANNIRGLRDAGASVIVDDVIYLDEPMFQDGVVAQAVDDVVVSGVAYLSAAGNSARKAYEHTFVPGTFIPAGTFGGAFLGGTPHNFGGSTMQRIAGPGGSSFTLVLQWDSPFFSVGNGSPGTSNDVDVYLLASNGAGGFFVVSSATTNNLMFGDPVELLASGCNPFAIQCVGFILIVNHAGPTPGRLKYVLYTAGPGNPTLSPAISSGTIYGHANAEGAVAVGAANYKTPTTLEPFSSGARRPCCSTSRAPPSPIRALSSLRSSPPTVPTRASSASTRTQPAFPTSSARRRQRRMPRGWRPCCCRRCRGWGRMSSE